jgi:hypothetical protein
MKKKLAEGGKVLLTLAAGTQTKGTMPMRLTLPSVSTSR